MSCSLGAVQVLHGGLATPDQSSTVDVEAAQALQSAQAAKQQALHLQKAAGEMKTAQLGMREVRYAATTAYCMLADLAQPYCMSSFCITGRLIQHLCQGWVHLMF